MRKLSLLASIALVVLATVPHSAVAQSNSLTYGNVPASIAPGGSFTFSVTLNFVSGGVPPDNEANLAALSLWLYQMNPAAGPFTLALTAIDRTGSLFNIAQTADTD